MTGFQDLVGALKLSQLVDGTRAKSFALRALVKMIFALITGDGGTYLIAGRTRTRPLR